VLSTFARKAAGASSVRHSLRPLNFRRAGRLQQTSRACGEIAKLWLRTAGCLKCEAGAGNRTRGTPSTVIARLDRAIQYSTSTSDKSRSLGVLDTRFRGYDDQR
jgi:hypothetical protein